MKVATNFKEIKNNTLTIIKGTTRFILGGLITDGLIDLKDMACLVFIEVFAQFLSNQGLKDLFYYTDKEINERQFRAYQRTLD